MKHLESRNLEIPLKDTPCSNQQLSDHLRGNKETQWDQGHVELYQLYPNTLNRWVCVCVCGRLGHLSLCTWNSSESLNRSIKVAAIDTSVMVQDHGAGRNAGGDPLVTPRNNRGLLGKTKMNSGGKKTKQKQKQMKNTKLSTTMKQSTTKELSKTQWL